MNLPRGAKLGVLFGAAVACGGTVLLGNPTDAGNQSAADAGSPIIGMQSEAGPPNGSDDDGGSPIIGLQRDARPPSEGHDASPNTPDVQTSTDGIASSPDAGQLAPFDAALPSLDAAISSLAPAPAGLAGFAFIVNNVVQQPLQCSTELWEFAPYPASSAAPGGCEPPGCPDIVSVIIVNTGALPMPYVVGRIWEVNAGPQAVPGIATSLPAGANAVAGVLEPGEMVSFASSYLEQITALLGSAEPFSWPDAGVVVTDEGTIFWPTGVAGSGGARRCMSQRSRFFPPAKR